MEKHSLDQLETERERLLKKRQSLVEEFTKAAGAGKQKHLSTLFIKIRQTVDFLDALELIKADADSKRGDAGLRRYAISSLFLHDSFRKLTADQAEQFFFITGSEVDDVLVLDQWAEFAHQQRTVGGVTGEPRATHGLLIKLEQFGHRLLAHFHSHPGRGIDSTRPSGIDENF